MSGKLLDKVLRKAGRLARLAQTARATGWAAVVLPAALLTTVGIDAILSVGPAALVALDLVLALALAAAAAKLIQAVRRTRYDPRRVSRMVEDRLAISDSSLINAVDLAAERNESFSQELAEAAVARADGLAAGLAVSRVIDGRRVRRAWVAGAGALAALMMAYLAMPGVFRAVLPRLLHPRGDLPPFTLVRFDVTVEPARVHYGRSASILASLSGPNLPDRADVVFVDGADRQVAPMIRGDDGRFLLRIDRADRTRDFHISTEAGRSGSHWLVVLPVPRFERAAVRYEFPSYTRWPEARATLDVSPSGAGGRHIRAIEGARATVTVKSNLPLGRGELLLVPAGQDGEGKDAGRPATVELAATEDATEVRGAFEVRFSGRYQIRLWGADGTPDDGALEGALTRNADALPQVRIDEPAMEVMAPEDWKIAVKISASDDVAVDRIELNPSVNGFGPGRLRLSATGRQPTFATAEHAFDLKALGARPGDVITYFATAVDNCPNASHFTDTPTYVIRVVSKEEYLAFARAQYRMDQVEREIEEFRVGLRELDRQRQELLEEFEALRRKLDAQDGRWTDADRRKLDELDRRHEPYARNERDLAGEMLRRADQPKIYEFEETYAEMLRQMGEGLDNRGKAAENTRQVLASIRVNQSLEQNGRRYLGLAAEQLEHDADPQRQAAQRIAQATRDAQKLAAADQMVAMAERITAITKQQRELADRLAAFRNKESLSPMEEIRARRMAGDQEQLRDELGETVELLRKLADDNRERLPKMSAGASRIASGVTGLDVIGDQDNAARLAQAGQGRYAHQAAATAAEKLESLHSECNAGTVIGLASDDLDGCLSLRKESLAESLRQLSEGRGIPGFGRAGGEGGGYYGTRAAVALVGPHVSGGGESDTRAGAQGRGTGRGPPARRTPSDAPGSESLTPSETTLRGAGAVAVPGVPVKYRELADSYFRRIADESK